MKNAFNSVWPVAVDLTLYDRQIPTNIRRIASSFMRDRTIQTEHIKENVNRGCPQGSSLGPILWLTLMEGFFTEIKKEITRQNKEDEDEVMVYADDQLILISDTSTKKIEKTWGNYWTRINKWADRNKLSYNNNKTETMYVTLDNKNKRTPVLKIEGETIKCKESIKYLGVIIDTKLQFLEHIKHIRAKVHSIGMKMKAVANREWGCSKENLKFLYENGIKRMILFGVEIWGKKGQDSRLKRQMDATQRPFILSINNAYKTTSTEALQAISGTIPLDIEIQTEYNMQTERRIDIQKK